MLYMRRQFFLALVLPLFICARVSGQEAVEHDVVVHGEADEFDEPGDYGQPEWAERSQASSTTKLYVLSAYEVFVGLFAESNFDRRGKPTQDLMQEIEIGCRIVSRSGSRIGSPSSGATRRRRWPAWRVVMRWALGMRFR